MFAEPPLYASGRFTVVAGSAPSARNAVDGAVLTLLTYFRWCHHVANLKICCICYVDTGFLQQVGDRLGFAAVGYDDIICFFFIVLLSGFRSSSVYGLCLDLSSL